MLFKFSTPIAPLNWLCFFGLCFGTIGCGWFDAKECDHRAIIGYEYDLQNACFPTPDDPVLLACRKYNPPVRLLGGFMCHYSPETNFVIHIENVDFAWASANGYEPCHPDYFPLTIYNPLIDEYRLEHACK